MSRTGRIEGTGVAASTLEIPDISLDLVLKSAGLIEDGAGEVEEAVGNR